MPKKKTTRKTTRKKTTTRKTASRSTTARKKTTTRKKTAARAGDRPRTKSQIFSDIAADTGLSKKEVQGVFDSMSTMIKKDLGRSGPGTFTVPGLMKIRKKAVPRRPARKNVWVPLLKEFRDIPAKPARKTVKVTPLKALKDMV